MLTKAFLATLKSLIQKMKLPTRRLNCFVSTPRPAHMPAAAATMKEMTSM